MPLSRTDETEVILELSAIESLSDSELLSQTKPSDFLIDRMTIGNQCERIEDAQNIATVLGHSDSWTLDENLFSRLRNSGTLSRLISKGWVVDSDNTIGEFTPQFIRDILEVAKTEDNKDLKSKMVDRVNACRESCQKAIDVLTDIEKKFSEADNLADLFTNAVDGVINTISSDAGETPFVGISDSRDTHFYLGEGKQRKKISLKGDPEDAKAGVLAAIAEEKKSLTDVISSQEKAYLYWKSSES